jgi:hypothetical protein
MSHSVIVGCATLKSVLVVFCRAAYAATRVHHISRSSLAMVASSKKRSRWPHVAAIILSSLITFGLAPSIAAAQSHLPPCPSDRNQVWTDCTGAYSYPDGSRYVGEFRDNKRNGQGALTFANGDKYVGEWSDGKENGQGTYTFLNGDKYIGEWGDGKRNGRGTETYPDGREYVGEWRNGKKNGQGTLTWPSGQKYVGEFKNDIQNGQGTYSFPNGAKYVGEIKDGLYDGRGTYTSAEGWTQRGLWNRGKFVKAGPPPGEDPHQY